MDTLADGTPNYEDLNYFKQREIYLLKQYSVVDHYTLNNPFMISDKRIYSEAVVIPYSQISNEKQLTLKICAQVILYNPVEDVLPTLVSKLRIQDSVYFEHYFELESLEINKPIAKNWTTVNFYFVTPMIEDPNQFNIQVFGWMRGKGSFMIKDIQIYSIEKRFP
jgi:hypothetical protein